MEESTIAFLSALSNTVFRLSAVIFLLVNSAAIAAFTMTRSRHLVNAWTARVLTIDAVLLGAGLGVPLLSGLAKLGVHAVATLFGGGAPAAP